MSSTPCSVQARDPRSLRPFCHPPTYTYHDGQDGDQPRCRAAVRVVRASRLGRRVRRLPGAAHRAAPPKARHLSPQPHADLGPGPQRPRAVGASCTTRSPPSSSSPRTALNGSYHRDIIETLYSVTLCSVASLVDTVALPSVLEPAFPGAPGRPEPCSTAPSAAIAGVGTPRKELMSLLLQTSEDPTLHIRDIHLAPLAGSATESLSSRYPAPVVCYQYHLLRAPPASWHVLCDIYYS